MVIGFNEQFPDKILAGTKKHTIRVDQHDRWHAGMKMHMAVGVRTKSYLCFKLDTCKSTQIIDIDYYLGMKYPMVVIDGCHFYNPYLNIDKGMLELSQNDGFESIEAFFEWFNKDFIGKLIHWTDLRY